MYQDKSIKQFNGKKKILFRKFSNYIRYLPIVQFKANDSWAGICFFATCNQNKSVTEALLLLSFCSVEKYHKYQATKINNKNVLVFTK